MAVKRAYDVYHSYDVRLRLFLANQFNNRKDSVGNFHRRASVIVGSNQHNHDLLIEINMMTTTTTKNDFVETTDETKQEQANGIEYGRIIGPQQSAARGQKLYKHRDPFPFFLPRRMQIYLCWYYGRGRLAVIN